MKINKLYECKKYFEKLLENINNISIIKICSLTGDCPTNDLKYSIDQPLYIIFQNYYILIIEYYDVCNLYIEYRKMTDEEKERFAKEDCQDFFTCTHEIYNPNTMKINRRINSLYKYDSISKIEVNNIKNDYDVLENGSIITRSANSEVFDKIIICLKNGNEIYLCPEDAISDGYLDIWCKGAKIDVTKYQ